MIDYLDKLQSRHLQVKHLLEEDIGVEFVTLSAITKLELIRGVRNKAELNSLNKNIYLFNILLINPAITTISLQLVEKYKLSHNLAIPDSLIAATAIYTGFKLFTFNQKDYRFINELTLYKL